MLCGLKWDVVQDTNTVDEELQEPLGPGKQIPLDQRFSSYREICLGQIQTRFFGTMCQY